MRFFLIFAALALSLCAFAACGGKTATAAHHPAMAMPKWLAAQAAWEVRNNTSSSTSALPVQVSGEWALVRRSVANTVMGDAAPPDPNASVYLVVLHGSFVANDATPPKGARPFHGNTIVFTMDPASHVVDDWGIGGSHTVDLSSVRGLSSFTP